MNHNIAAVDIGTNSFHLIIVQADGKGNFEIIDREKEVIRLSEGSTGDIKFIKNEAIERAIGTLKKFKGIADSHNASLIAVATSAVRESSNKNEFISKVRDEVGIDIDVISGNEEARLIYLGILKAVPIFNEKTLCIDIGGGSTEFVLGHEGKILYSKSLKLGAVRLTQKFFPDAKLTKEGINACRGWVEGMIFSIMRDLKDHTFKICVGSSGTIMSAGLMISAARNEDASPTTILNNFEISDSELSKIGKEILSKKSTSDRKNIPGLDLKRADIIPAGIILLNTIVEKLKIPKIIISGYALREGIIIEELSKLQDKSAVHNLSDIRYESVKQLMDSCNYSRDHCKHVSILALQIFDQLKQILELNDKSREYLEAAALLHDIGYHISYSKHHKHSYYIIRNSQLLGFNEGEINIIANIARYHRKSHPKNRHYDFNLLPEASKVIVRQSAAILRLADSLDRTHSAKISSFTINKTNKKIELMINNVDNIPEIELWNFEMRKDLFEEVFGLPVILRS